ncbi:hypothetical protein FJ366_01425 [Candidatus Dependentiae bacterium]|nr:hypothetical protein [Candidatus Dependentiae bacterium]
MNLLFKITFLYFSFCFSCAYTRQSPEIRARIIAASRFESFGNGNLLTQDEAFTLYENLRELNNAEMTSLLFALATILHNNLFGQNTINERKRFFRDLIAEERTLCRNFNNRLIDVAHNFGNIAAEE